MTSIGVLEVGEDHVMHPGKGMGISDYVQDLACYVGQQEVYDEAEVLLKRVGGIDLSDKQIERLCHKYGNLLEQDPVVEAVTESSDLHYGMLDGGFVLTREKDDKGKCKWMEMKLGRVFNADSRYVLGHEASSRHWIKKSAYVAHLGNCDDFYEKFRHLLKPYKQLIIIGDGARWIWERVSKYHKNAIQILDFFHVLEHLGTILALCWKLNFETQKEKEAWVETQKALFLAGKSDKVCENIANLTMQNEEGTEKQADLIRYYENNKTRMKYDEYVAKGWLIGSGPIEAAHREVIQKRMKRSGQRWTKNGAQCIANLRVAYKSEKWESVTNLIQMRA